ncbi:MAG: hypothetical protein EOO09_01155 [Chitinophagaceae bacterium]|nr:MAG: hypothetical protein EOO09_01155 [Chitinophagaceae bacterium]
MGDKRITIEKKEDFLPVLKEILDKGEQASVLYDDGGVTRASGRITSLTDAGPDAGFVLEDNTVIKLDALYAVNGLFSGDYSEC